MRIALAILMTLHGIAHLVGFASAWGFVDSDELPHTTTIAGSAIDLGAAGMRVYGLVWMLAAGAFVGTAVALAGRAPHWYAATLAVTAASTVLCLLSWPASRIGLAVNAVIVVCVLVGSQRGWLPQHP